MDLDDRTRRHLALPSDDLGEHDVDDDPDHPVDPAAEDEAERKRQLHQRAMEDYKASRSFFADQRKWESQWRKFYRAIELADQWDEGVVDARQGWTAGESDQERKGQRPCLTMNEVKQPIQHGINEARQARLGLYVKPERGEASKVEAETRQGILRAIQYHSNAIATRLWALESAFVAGRGFYAVDKVYAHDGDDDIDLRLRFILHQDSVHPDPACSQLDLSDASFGIIADDFSHQAFTAKFPNALPPVKPDNGGDLGEYVSEWINDRTYRVAEYYYVDQYVKLRYLDGEWTDLVGEEVDDDGEPVPILFDTAQEAEKALPEGIIRWRAVPVRKVKWALVTAMEVLDEADWEGDYIPILQTVGRVHVVDGKVMFKGLLHDGMNPQQLINYAISSLAEQTGTGTRIPYLLDPKQIEQFKEWWDNSNTENYPYLPFERFIDGQDYGPPQRNAFEPPIMATLQVLIQARELLKACMGRYGASLGDISPDRSGKAIDAMKVQGELGSSDFLDNMAMYAMTQESRVLNSMLYGVYGEPGRLVKMLGDDEDDEAPALVNQPFRLNADGQPVPIETPNLLQRMGGAVMNGVRAMAGRAQPTAESDIKEYRLTQRGTYDVRWVVGKSELTERDENVRVLSSILESAGKVDPQLARETAIALLENLDGPAARKLVERLTPKGPNGEEVPAELRALLEQMKQQRDEAVAAATEMQTALKGKQMDLQMQQELQAREMQFKHAIEAQRLRIELMKIQQQTAGKLSEQELKIQLEALKGEQRKLELLLEQAHEKDMQATELATEERQQQRQLTAAADQQERGAVLTEAQRQNSVTDARVDSAVDASRRA